MLRRSISAITGACLIVGVLMSVSWWWQSPKPGFEAAANVFALLAAVAGIPAERWAAARERRVRALRAIRHELAKNREILDTFTVLGSLTSVRRMVYPRLVATAVQTALISGAFAAPGDPDRVQALYEWRTAVDEFNRRLDITEIHMFTLRTIDPSLLHRFRQALHGEGGYVEFVRGRIEAVEQMLDMAERDGGHPPGAPR
jgi:hypothetical protein